MRKKTRKIAAKRFKLSASGKLMRRRQNHRHLIKAKSKSQLRRLQQKTGIAKKLARKIKSMLS